MCFHQSFAIVKNTSSNNEFLLDLYMYSIAMIIQLKKLEVSTCFRAGFDFTVTFSICKFFIFVHEINNLFKIPSYLSKFASFAVATADPPYVLEFHQILPHLIIWSRIYDQNMQGSNTCPHLSIIDCLPISSSSVIFC